MNKPTEAKDKFIAGYACSQAVFTTFSGQLGIDELTALKVSSYFAGGMRIGETCGAVTGALMVLGVKFSPDSCHIMDDRKATYKFVEEFYSKFLEKHKSLKCKELMGADISTPEGRAEAESKDLHHTVCPAFVNDATEILEEMLSK